MSIQDDFRKFSDQEKLEEILSGERLHRRPDRRIITIDVSNFSKDQAEEYIVRLKNKFKGK